MTDEPTPAEPTPRPWAILDGRGPFDGAIVSPQGDAEIGNWMVAERIRWPVDAALIVRAVNAHDGLVAAVEEMLRNWESGFFMLSDEVVDQARRALAKAQS